jgi:hypothetical protein
MRTRSWILTTVAGLLICALAATPALACPMCKLANDSDSRLPMAYMYSIIFMMAMPATLLTGFSISFWRLSRQAVRMQLEAAEQAASGAADPAVEATADVASPDFSGESLPGTGLVFP